jgi:hypothetical protein
MSEEQVVDYDCQGEYHQSRAKAGSSTVWVCISCGKEETAADMIKPVTFTTAAGETLMMDRALFGANSDGDDEYEGEEEWGSTGWRSNGRPS